ncbi:MAG TPA: FtsX-like permease family protein [Candidatus Wirthbacteria bacterium]|nr:FtsX-like permease family protein [Candidatus Wirthbacteria bacterium]
MFYLAYLKSELLRRFGKTLTISLGLACASAIIIVIVSVSTSLQDSQKEVLDPLSNVGTDMLITRTVSQDNIMQMDELTRQEMMNDNRVTTDLASLGSAGEQFSADSFATGGNLSFSGRETANLDPTLVADFAGGLILNVTHQEGTIPTITATFQTGGQRYQMTQEIEFTEEDLQAFQEANRGSGGGRHFRSITTEFVVPEETIIQDVDIPETDIKTSTYTIAGIDPTNQNIGLILPSQIIAGNYFTPLTIIPTPSTAEDHILETPTDETQENQIESIDNNEQENEEKTATSDATLELDNAQSIQYASLPSETIISQAYAQKENLTIGDTILINNRELTIIGIVEPKLYTNTADLYVTLPLLQEISDMLNRVNILLIKSTHADQVETTSTALASIFAGATVTSAADTAKQVSGSLLSVTNLMDKFIGIVSLVVLIAAFVIVSLLTVLSVNKRIREIGTLKAIGWSNYRIIRQILLENLVLGILGAGAGIGLALLIIYGLNNANINLTADITSLNSSLGGAFGRMGGFGGMGRPNETTTNPNLTKDIALIIVYSPYVLLVGALVSLVGSITAGLLASIKASRLSPQIALRNIE